MDAERGNALAAWNSRPVYVKRLGVALYLLALAFIVLTESPLRFWDSGLAGTDSSVFQTVAMMMRRGFMPYRDSFDHKGPLIYFIDYLGMLFSPRWGIWLLELVSAFVTFGAMYRTARLWCGRVGSCLAVSVGALPLFSGGGFFDGSGFFDGGNLVEEYAMPFIAVAVYIFLDYLESGQVTRLRLAVCGLCLAGVCLLRVNMIAVWIVFCLAIAGRCLAGRDFAQLGEFILWFLAGFAAALLPFLLWLAANGSLVPFLQDYILFNMVYAVGQDGAALSLFDTLQFYLQKQMVQIVLACAAGAALFAKGKERFLRWSYFACLVLSLVLVAMARYTFPHYGMVLVPLFSVPIAGLGRWVSDRLADAAGGRVLKGVVAAAAAVVILSLAQTAQDNMDRTVTYQDPELVYTLCSVIQDYCGPDDSISVFGNWDIIYLKSGRPHATTYSYQSPIGSISPEIMEDYYAQLARERPRVIVMPQVASNEVVGQYYAMEEVFAQQGYTQVWAQVVGYWDGAAVYARLD